MFSVVITCFNRDWSIIKAVESACNFIENLNRGEVIIVDDCSTDSSVKKINKYISSSNFENIKLITLKTNTGVNNARNIGCLHSSEKWIIFLDSDDEIISSQAKNVYNLMINNKNKLHFFKCEDENGNIVGKKIIKDKSIGFNEILKNGTYGECMVVIDKSTIIKYPYLTNINGFEGLLYLKLIDIYGPATLHSLILRKYNTSHNDRLSSKEGISKRYSDLYKGNLHIITNYMKKLSVYNLSLILLKCAYYRLKMNIL